MHARSRFSLAAATLAVALAATVVPAATAVATSTNTALASARTATAAFHDPATAKAAGYLPSNECVAVPGLGVMGQHWVNPKYFTTDASTLTPAHPQALLYVPGTSGPRLVAIEYIVFAPGATPAANPDQVDPNGPQLFGQHFNGLMAGHTPSMPTHWDLHVWTWQHNPNGMFAQFNPSPALGC